MNITSSKHLQSQNLPLLKSLLILLESQHELPFLSEVEAECPKLFNSEHLHSLLGLSSKPLSDANDSNTDDNIIISADDINISKQRLIVVLDALDATMLDRMGNEEESMTALTKTCDEIIGHVTPPSVRKSKRNDKVIILDNNTDNTDNDSELLFSSSRQGLMLAVLIYFEQQSSSRWFKNAYVQSDSTSATSTATAPIMTPSIIVNALLNILIDDVSGKEEDHLSDGQESNEEGNSNSNSKTGITPSKLKMILTSFYVLLSRFHSCFVPCNGDFAEMQRSALPELTRLVLQYHDPQLTSHLDHLPLSKNMLRLEEHNIGLSTEREAPIITTSRSLYLPLTLEESCLMYCCHFHSSVGSRGSLRENGDDDGKEMIRILLGSNVFDGLLTTFPVGTVLSGTTMHAGSVCPNKGKVIFPNYLFTFFFFIGRVIARRDELLSLNNAAEIAEYWKVFNPIQRERGEYGNKSGSASPLSKCHIPPLFNFQQTHAAGQTVSLDGCNANQWASAALFVYNNTPATAKGLLSTLLHVTSLQQYYLLSEMGREAMKEYVRGLPALPVSAIELAETFPSAHLMFNITGKEEDPASGESSSIEMTTISNDNTLKRVKRTPIKYIVLDCRSEESYAAARLPTALHIGDDIGYDTVLLRSLLAKLDGVRYSHMTVMGTGRDIVDEVNLLKLAIFNLTGYATADHFVKSGGDNSNANGEECDGNNEGDCSIKGGEGWLPYISVVDGGFKECIPFLKSNQMEYVVDRKNNIDHGRSDRSTRPGSTDIHPSRNINNVKETMVGVVSAGTTMAAEVADIVATSASHLWTNIHTKRQEQQQPQQPPSQPPVVSESPTEIHSTSDDARQKVKAIAAKTADNMSYMGSWGAGLLRKAATTIATSARYTKRDTANNDMASNCSSSSKADMDTESLKNVSDNTDVTASLQGHTQSVDINTIDSAKTFFTVTNCPEGEEDDDLGLIMNVSHKTVVSGSFSKESRSDEEQGPLSHNCSQQSPVTYKKEENDEDGKEKSASVSGISSSYTCATGEKELTEEPVKLGESSAAVMDDDEFNFLNTSATSLETKKSSIATTSAELSENKSNPTKSCDTKSISKEPHHPFDDIFED
eukprot:Tbor_TRINITY_DN3648_c0_g1::TRINITY_DN3648_c0_g1_i1::g.384::m.384